MGYNLFVDAEHPGAYVGVMVVGDVVDGEDGAVLLGGPALGPERRKLLLEKLTLQKEELWKRG